MKTLAQICKQLQAFLHRLFENTKTAITFCKKKKKFKLFKKKKSGRVLDNRTGRNTVRAGRSALRNMPSWNTGSYDVLEDDNAIFNIFSAVVS